MSPCCRLLTDWRGVKSDKSYQVNNSQGRNLVFHKDTREWGKSLRHCAAAQEEQRAAGQKVLGESCVCNTTIPDLKYLCDGLAWFYSNVLDNNAVVPLVSRTELWATWSTWCPGSLQGWTRWSLKVISNTNYSMNIFRDLFNYFKWIFPHFPSIFHKRQYLSILKGSIT